MTSLKWIRFRQQFFEPLLFYFVSWYKTKAFFLINNDKLKYFIHPYNVTSLNERSVEIAYVSKYISHTFKDTRLLEVGNVLKHYFPHLKHKTIDKYEKFRSVINEDILDFSIKEKYDLIVSISTFEHIGYDEDVKDKGKILKVITKLKSLLTNKGKILVTIPLGYNLVLDQAIFSGKIIFTKTHFLKKNLFGLWKEVSVNDVLGIKYDYCFSSAKALFIGLLYK